MHTISGYQFVLRVDIVDDPAVLNGGLHIAGPERLDDGSEWNDARGARLGEHVKLHVLLARLEELRTVVQHYHRLV